MLAAAMNPCPCVHNSVPALKAA